MSCRALHRLAAVSALVFAAGCVFPQRPTFFLAPNPAEPAMDVASRTLTAGGLEVMNVDTLNGVIHTNWEDLGIAADRLSNPPPTLLRRYIISVLPERSRTLVAVRAEARACTPGRFVMENGEVRGACHPVPTLPPPQLRQMEELGWALQRAFGVEGGPPVPVR